MLAPTARHLSVTYGGFFRRLRELGYVEDRNLRIHYLSSEGNSDRFPALAQECLRLKANVIVGGTTPASIAAKNATRTVPIVLVGTGDPVATGLVESLGRPGGAGNITGLSHMAPGLMVKRLELLKEIAPRLSKVLVLAHLADPVAAPQIRELSEAARMKGVKVVVQDIKTESDLSAAFEIGEKEGAEAVMTTVEAIFNVHRKRVAELAAAYRLPGISPYAGFAESGGLMAYGVNFPEFFAGAAVFVDKLLKGAKAADLPIEQPTQFDFVINSRTAKALGLAIPSTLMLRASRVID